MKKIILLSFCIVFAIVSKAQSNTDEITFMQSVYGMQKKQLIEEHMKISDSQKAAFWKLYDEYEVSRKAIGMKRANNIEEYAKKYDGLTNENAEALLKASFGVQKDFVKLWEKTYKKMAKETSPLTAVQFIQVEMYLENLVRQSLTDEIPLIGEFEPKK
jgi:hypothetical protein